MKRSKIVLGAVALLLAAAGASASAVSYRTAIAYYEATPGDKTSCTQVNIDFICNTTNPNPCVGEDPLSPSLGQQLYVEQTCQTQYKKAQ